MNTPTSTFPTTVFNCLCLNNEAVIQIQGRSHKVQHFLRTHRFDLDRRLERVNLGSNISIRFLPKVHSPFLSGMI